ncbi:4157_t:CDS:2, partial [Dentiscutata heterogama]
CATSNFTYFESGKKSKMTTQTPRVLDIKHYEDGTGAIIVQIIRRNASMTPQAGLVCVESLLSLRIIHQNGSVTEIDVDLGIQYLNYCFGSDVSIRPIRIYPLYDELILMTYTNATDEGDFSTYNEWGMVINWSGNVLSSTFFGQSYVNPVTKSWTPNQAAIRINIDPKQGFLRLSQITGRPESEWKHDANGQISLLSGDIIQEYGNVSTTIATIDGGYAIVYANNTANINISDDPFMT